MSVINLREYMKRVYTELENYIEGLSEEERVDLLQSSMICSIRELRIMMMSI